VDNSNLFGFGPNEVTQSSPDQDERSQKYEGEKDPLRRPLKWGKSSHTISLQSDETKNVLQII